MTECKIYNQKDNCVVSQKDIYVCHRNISMCVIERYLCVPQKDIPGCYRKIYLCAIERKLCVKVRQMFVSQKDICVCHIQNLYVSYENISVYTKEGYLSAPQGANCVSQRENVCVIDRYMCVPYVYVCVIEKYLCVSKKDIFEYHKKFLAQIGGK